MFSFSFSLHFLSLLSLNILKFDYFYFLDIGWLVRVIIIYQYQLSIINKFWYVIKPYLLVAPFYATITYKCHSLSLVWTRMSKSSVSFFWSKLYFFFLNNVFFLHTVLIKPSQRTWYSGLRIYSSTIMKCFYVSRRRVCCGDLLELR